MDRPKTALVTGASRGVGEYIALEFANHGVDSLIGYRDKQPRAAKVAAKVGEILTAKGFNSQRLGAFGADITDKRLAEELMRHVYEQLGERQLDYLVLNAAGGMEKDAENGYHYKVNRDAPLDIAELALEYELLRPGSRILYTVSSQSHYYGSNPNPALSPPEYEPVASSKSAGELALVELVSGIDGIAESGPYDIDGIHLGIVSTDMIPDSTSVRLLARRLGIDSSALVNQREQEIRHWLGLGPESPSPLLSMAEYGRLVVSAAFSETTDGPVYYVRNPDFGKPSRPWEHSL
jgi:NAD(P)-dependent dehydrogenase (short-subunit alcohol dehydrogenase family)